MSKSKTLKNPWVVSVVGVGLAVLGSCNEIRNPSGPLKTSPEHHPHKEHKEHPMRTTETAYAPSARACHKSPSNLLISLDFLYWGAKQEDFVYAASYNSSSSKFSDQQIDNNWGPGLRIGIGGNLSYDNWDLFVNWTHWHSTKTSNADDSFQSLSPILVSYSDSIDYTFNHLITANSATNHWKVNFDTFDVELGKSYSISKKLNLRPHVGLEYAQILQNFNVEYDSVTLVSGGGYVGTVYDGFKGVNNFRGIGPRLGVHTRWMLGDYVGIFGDLATALLWGNLQSKSRLLNSGTTGFSLQNNTHGLKPTAQFVLGLDWSKCFSDKYNLRIGAAYEAQIWWNQLEMPKRSSTESNGNFTTEGLTANFRFEF